MRQRYHEREVVCQADVLPPRSKDGQVCAAAR